MKAAKLPGLPTWGFAFEADHSYGAWKREGDSNEEIGERSVEKFWGWVVDTPRGKTAW